MNVRPATEDDASGCAVLLAALGYPADVEVAARRLERLRASEDAGVLVAVVDAEVIALLAYQLIFSLERSAPQCRITTLITEAGFRRGGAATALLARVESIATERGCDRLEVTTRPEREDALAFYRSANFSEQPRRLVKSL